jgi:hypothetical protein
MTLSDVGYWNNSPPVWDPEGLAVPALHIVELLNETIKYSCKLNYGKLFTIVIKKVYF